MSVVLSAFPFDKAAVCTQSDQLTSVLKNLNFDEGLVVVNPTKISKHMNLILVHGHAFEPLSPHASVVIHVNVPDESASNELFPFPNETKGASSSYTKK